jgi:hypothetical protein
MAESWFGTIKIELVYRRIWRTRHEGRAGDLPLDRGVSLQLCKPEVYQDRLA